MHVKSLRRIVLMVVAMVASSLSLVAVSTAPAHAAGVATDSHIQVNRTSVTYGGTVSITGWASLEGETDPGYPGSISLERKYYGQSGWSTVSTKSLTDAERTPTWTTTPAKTAYYRVHFLGYPGSAEPSYSSPVKVSVRRKITSAGNESTFVYYGKVTPSYGKRTVVIRKSTCSNPQSSSCSWTTFKNVTTTSTGNYSVRLPVYSRRTHFRAMVPASNGYLGNTASLIITTYRY
jgi:hypothetical protein